MAVYLSFLPNGKGYKAEHDGMLYLVYPMNYGYAWHIAEINQRPYIRFSDGVKYPDQLDCIDTTVQSTIKHMSTILEEHNFKVSWNYRL